MDKLIVEVASSAGIGHKKPTNPGFVNNQDAVEKITYNGEPIGGVICDGCGSLPHCDVGARFGALNIAKLIEQSLIDNQGKSVDWGTVNSGILEKIQKTSEMFNAPGLSVEATMQNYFSFTIIIGLVIGKEFVVAACGDGLYMADDKLVEIHPPPLVTGAGSPLTNAPPYIVYQLISSHYDNQHRDLLEIKELERFKLSSVKKSMLIGSDGLSPFIRANRDAIHQPELLHNETNLQDELNKAVFDTSFITLLDDVSAVLIRTEKTQKHLEKTFNNTAELKRKLAESEKTVGDLTREIETLKADLASYKKPAYSSGAYAYGRTYPQAGYVVNDRRTLNTPAKAAKKAAPAKAAKKAAPAKAAKKAAPAVEKLSEEVLDRTIPLGEESINSDAMKLSEIFEYANKILDLINATNLKVKTFQTETEILEIQREIQRLLGELHKNPYNEIHARKLVQDAEYIEIILGKSVLKTTAQTDNDLVKPETIINLAHIDSTLSRVTASNIVSHALDVVRIIDATNLIRYTIQEEKEVKAKRSAIDILVKRIRKNTGTRQDAIKLFKYSARVESILKIYSTYSWGSAEDKGGEAKAPTGAKTQEKTTPTAENTTKDKVEEMEQVLARYATANVNSVNSEIGELFISDIVEYAKTVTENILDEDLKRCSEKEEERVVKAEEAIAELIAGLDSNQNNEEAAVQIFALANFIEETLGCYAYFAFRDGSAKTTELSNAINISVDLSSVCDDVSSLRVTEILGYADSVLDSIKSVNLFKYSREEENKVILCKRTINVRKFDLQRFPHNQCAAQKIYACARIIESILGEEFVDQTEAEPENDSVQEIADEKAFTAEQISAIVAESQHELIRLFNFLQGHPQGETKDVLGEIYDNFSDILLTVESGNHDSDKLEELNQYLEKIKNALIALEQSKKEDESTEPEEEVADTDKKTDQELVDNFTVIEESQELADSIVIPINKANTGLPQIVTDTIKNIPGVKEIVKAVGGAK